MSINKASSLKTLRTSNEFLEDKRLENKSLTNCSKEEIINKNSVKAVTCVYLILFFSSVLANMSISSFPAVIETIKKELHIESEASIGLLATVNYLGQLLGKKINIIIFKCIIICYYAISILSKARQSFSS